MVKRKDRTGRSRYSAGRKPVSAPPAGPLSTFEVMRKDGMNMSWSLDSRLKLALAAVEFFDAEKRKRMEQLLPQERPHAGGEEPRPFSLLDFALYLEARQVFARKPNHFRVQHIVARLAAEGFLVQVGYFGGVPAPFGEQYLCFRGMFGTDFRGNLWLAPVLGPELLYKEAGPGVVHITGTREGRAVGGTGVVVHPNYVATCRHVVEGVELDRRQRFQGRECVLDPSSVRLHPAEYRPRGPTSPFLKRGQLTGPASRHEPAPPPRRSVDGSNGCSTQATAYLRATPPPRRGNSATTGETTRALPLCFIASARSTVSQCGK